MRKLVCIIGLLLSVCMIAVAALATLGIVIGVRDMEGMNVSDIIGVELPDLDASALEAVAAMDESGDLMAGVGSVAATLPMLLTVALGKTVADYALLIVVGIVVLFFVGIVGMLVSIYGMNAAGASS